MNSRKSRVFEAELDITAFMNLMIVLVPILLLGMVFSRITVVDVTLPESSSLETLEEDSKQVELVVRPDSMRVDFPRGIMLKEIPLTEQGEYDYALLSLVLQEVKRQLLEQGLERRSITLLCDEEIDYQTIVTVMDSVRSFRAVVAASVVDAMLFPDIAFGDAPSLDEGAAG